MSIPGGVISHQHGADLQMRLVAGALEELFESVAKRGKALRAANPTTFQMDLTVAVANEVSLDALPLSSLAKVA